MVGNIVDVGWATIKSGCLPITDPGHPQEELVGGRPHHHYIKARPRRPRVDRALKKNTHTADNHAKKLAEASFSLKWTIFKLCCPAHLFPNTPRSMYVQGLPLSTTNARIYRPRFRENKPKTLVFNRWKRAFLGLFCKNLVYKFGHCSMVVQDTPFHHHQCLRAGCIPVHCLHCGRAGCVSNPFHLCKVFCVAELGDLVRYQTALVPD